VSSFCPLSYESPLPKLINLLHANFFRLSLSRFNFPPAHFGFSLRRSPHFFDCKVMIPSLPLVSFFIFSPPFLFPPSSALWALYCSLSDFTSVLFSLLTVLYFFNIIFNGLLNVCSSPPVGYYFLCPSSPP